MALLLDAPGFVRREAGIVRVGGQDRLTYLHSLLSQHLESATPGEVADFLYLDAKGNPQAVGRAMVRAADVWLVTPAELAADLAAALEKYRFLMQVEAADISDGLRVASLRGPSPILFAGAPHPPLTANEEADGIVVRDRSGGVDLIGTPHWVDRQLRSVDLPEASAAEYEAWRIAAGEPAWGREILPGRRSQELGLLPTHVHLRKGCYPGQESVAKIYNLGRPRRALAVLEADAALPVGAAVQVEGKTGEVTSAADAGGRWLALALVPVGVDGSLPAGTEVAVAGAAARVVRRVGEGVAQPGT